MKVIVLLIINFFAVCMHTCMYAKLNHIPSHCIVLMVHIVKGCMHIHIDTGASITEMESKTNSHAILIGKSFNASITRD